MSARFVFPRHHRTASAGARWQGRPGARSTNGGGEFHAGHLGLAFINGALLSYLYNGRNDAVHYQQDGMDEDDEFPLGDDDD